MSETRRAISRRKFGHAALLGAALPVVAAAPQDSTAAENAEVEARYSNVIRQYGERLSEQQRQRIRRILSANERMMSRIREFPLDNGDAPAPVLKLEVGK